MPNPIAQINDNGTMRALVFNNGVVDVQQNGVSLVNEDKVAIIPASAAPIDNKTIIINGNQEMEVPFDNNTIYRDSEDGFIKANVGAEVHDSKIILCTQVGSDPAGPVGSFTLNQDSNKTITIPIPEPEVKEYTAGANISISSEGVISAVDTKYTAGTGISIDNNVISATGGPEGDPVTVVSEVEEDTADEPEYWGSILTLTPSGTGWYQPSTGNDEWIELDEDWWAGKLAHRLTNGYSTYMLQAKVTFDNGVVSNWSPVSIEGGEDVFTASCRCDTVPGYACADFEIEYDRSGVTRPNPIPYTVKALLSTDGDDSIAHATLLRFRYAKSEIKLPDSGIYPNNSRNLVYIGDGKIVLRPSVEYSFATDTSGLDEDWETYEDGNSYVNVSANVYPTFFSNGNNYQSFYNIGLSLSGTEPYRQIKGNLSAATSQALLNIISNGDAYSQKQMTWRQLEAFTKKYMKNDGGEFVAGTGNIALNDGSRSYRYDNLKVTCVISYDDGFGAAELRFWNADDYQIGRIIWEFSNYSGDINGTTAYYVSYEDDLSSLEPDFNITGNCTCGCSFTSVNPLMIAVRYQDSTHRFIPDFID